MNWLDDWLEGLVHRSAQGAPTDRSRHERFMVSRTVAALAALAGLPPYLLSRGVPAGLECLAFVALAMPLAGVLVLSRTGNLVAAQAVVSAGLAVFAAGAAVAFGGFGTVAMLALLAVPLDALHIGSRRAVAVSIGAALLGLLAVLAFEANGLITGTGTALASVLTVTAAYAFGHALAQAAHERRFKALIGAALRSGEARESAALQAIDDLITWHDRNGSVLRANGAATKLVGVPHSMLLGRGLFGRIHIMDRPAYLKAISDAARSADPVVVQVRLQVGEMQEGITDPNGVLARAAARPAQMIWVEMRAHRLAGSDDDCRVVAVTRDITEHKDHADDLDAMRRDAERAGQGRAQLLATLSHELRTPLNAIIGYSEMLTGKSASASLETRSEYADIINRSGQHMLGMVSTLLDLSTIEAGRYELRPEPIEVQDWVREGCRLVSLMAERAGVKLVQDVTPGLPELHADRRACLQILLNLLSNAVKFTPQGGLVTVMVRREVERLTLSVSDTGIGVCQAELPRLGSPFYQAAGARGRPDKGSGLGLSVVRGLVELHRGRVAIASAPGKGTTVTVNLPLDSGLATRAPLPALLHTQPRSPNGILAFKTG